MKIVQVVLSQGYTGFYFDDLSAIRQNAAQDGFTYQGIPVTKGFSSIRQAGESISMMLILEDGQVAVGDCAMVQYPGVGGRDPLFSAQEFMKVIEQHVSPRLIGRELKSFRELAEEVDHIEIDGALLHSAIRYGATQAILDAVAKAKKITMAEVIREEYHIDTAFKKVPIFAQTGDDRYLNVDKMIMKEVDVLPHGLINNVKEKLGSSGEHLNEYVHWLKNRIVQLRKNEQYSPVLHIDVYGTIGLAFDYDLERIADYLRELEKIAFPFPLRIESPMDCGDREAQWQNLKSLRSILKQKAIRTEIVADEWCNTKEDIYLFVDQQAADMIQIKSPDLGGIHNIIESILYCKQHGVGAYCGGSCNETEISARITTQIAIACGADQCLAKPGMGVDEGYMIVNNEMNRVLALCKLRENMQIT
ncbi:methylaspartate ammonia-lyase [Paenibacillus sp. GP183]|uniref:methylaspartate ammonia-lyase n=1 Tax=Paenibacillus sp. GP183 TaxID=1882751 RepID=UPI00089A282E|nr:methylaspartate ammonia-lyase [Paenibacillus sp. GP183]SED06750.1 methylaspartate ammonia-lyase [Paenibacillus sp. GP183]